LVKDWLYGKVKAIMATKTTKKPASGKKIDIKNTRFLITGGTGSLGKNIIRKLLSLGAEHILSVSRNEDLIKKAERDIPSPFVKFKMGDITDKALVENIMKDVDVVFNTAAVKHVSLAEQNPRETYRINILGLLNLLDAGSQVKRFIHISSDKAIGVMNCYGSTKLLGEYLVRESNTMYNNDAYLLTRCPNFLGSRGSVTDVWKETVKKNNKVTITDPEMTRYFVTLSDAANFLIDTGLENNIDVKKIYYPLKYTKKYRLKDLAEAFLKVYGNKDSKIEIVGAFPGEKRHEDYIEDMPLISVKELVSILKELK
jgi:UDP-N-acetylglucosamine 4,6-dehydratase/5-epimerase